MKKYLTAYSISLQETLQRRSTLIMDRLGGFAVIVSLYSFWSALMGGQTTFLGYTRAEMLTYVLITNILRSFVFTGRGWYIVGEISTGKIASYLVRPIDYRGYALALDLANKTVHVASAFVEVAVLALLVRGGIYLPTDPAAWLLFIVSSVLASLLFFSMEFIIASLAFWTSESGGPLFCFELFLQFAAGAFFPLDVLPKRLLQALNATPFPYMVNVPAKIFLQKFSAGEAARLLTVETAWLAAFLAASALVWRRGIHDYAAEGG